MADFAILRDILSQPPSTSSFVDIIELFDQWSAPELTTGLAYAAEHLASWPDHLRCAGEQLFFEEDDCLTTKPKPQASLARMCKFTPSHADLPASFLAALTRSPAFQNLTILDMIDLESDEHIDTDIAIRELVHSPHLQRLTTLRIGGDIGPGGWKALADADFPRLQELVLRGTIEDDKDAKHLAQAPITAHLVKLVVDFMDVEEEGFLALGMSPFLPQRFREYYLPEVSTALLSARAEALGLAVPTSLSRDELIEELLKHQRNTQSR